MKHSLAADSRSAADTQSGERKTAGLWWVALLALLVDGTAMAFGWDPGPANLSGLEASTPTPQVSEFGWDPGPANRSTSETSSNNALGQKWPDAWHLWQLWLRALEDQR